MTDTNVIFMSPKQYLATGVTFKQYQSAEQEGKYFPYRAEDWANTAKTIPHFIVDNIDPQMGDVWSNGHHTGIYLGQYNGIKLYISARDNGEGVYGLPIIQRNTAYKLNNWKMVVSLDSIRRSYLVITIIFIL